MLWGPKAELLSRSLMVEKSRRVGEWAGVMECKQARERFAPCCLDSNQSWGADLKGRRGGVCSQLWRLKVDWCPDWYIQQSGGEGYRGGGQKPPYMIRKGCTVLMSSSRRASKSSQPLGVLQADTLLATSSRSTARHRRPPGSSRRTRRCPSVSTEP